MIEQLAFTTDGRIRGKVDAAIERLRCFEPEDGYYVAFSGGKDSQCIYHLCQMAGVKFDAHYAVTSVDPPELVQFIKEHYPDAWEGRAHQYREGNPLPVTMWSLIQEHNVPPSRKLRYCCADLKEPGGSGRVTVTGVRWGESLNRSSTHGVVSMPNAGKRIKKIAQEFGANATQNKRGGVIMNDDNDESRRAVEHCYRTSKTLVNPIVDWTDEDVWEFLNSNGIEHCKLYDEGFTRLGCIGCPLAGHTKMMRDFKRWPKYREMYVKAFDRMIKTRRDEMFWLKRVEGTNTFVVDDSTEGLGEAMLEYWIWSCHPDGQKFPDRYQLVKSGASYERALEVLRRNGFTIEGLIETDKETADE